jgi:hypothetical protein
LIQYQNHGRKRIRLTNQIFNFFLQYLYGLVKGSQSESLLLCILSRIICIRDDQAVRLVIFKRKSCLIFFTFSYSYLHLIDECIQRIVFSKTACDPDFDTYSMDSEFTGDSDVAFNDNRSSIDLSQMDEHVKNYLQATENQIQLDLMKGQIEHLEHTKEKVRNQLMTINRFGIWLVNRSMQKQQKA